MAKELTYRCFFGARRQLDRAVQRLYTRTGKESQQTVVSDGVGILYGYPNEYKKFTNPETTKNENEL